MDEKLEHPVPVEVEARSGYTIFVAFSDGQRGEVDLSEWSNKEAFRRWEEREFFESVHVDDRKAIAWGSRRDLDVCADTIYMMLTGATVEDLFPRLQGLMEEYAWIVPSRRNHHLDGLYGAQSSSFSCQLWGIRDFSSYS